MINTSNERRPFLSEVIEPELFKKGQANIVVAPCHSGKTTAAVTRIASLASTPERVLFLIDTTAGKQALLKRGETARYTQKWLDEIKHEWWGELLSGSGIRVMTYHQLGYQLQDHPNFMENIEVVVCDEMHNLIKFLNIERTQNKKSIEEGWGSMGNPCEIALNELCRISAKQENVPLVVIITATIKAVSKELHARSVPTEYFDYTQRAYSDRSKRIIYYDNLNQVLDDLGDNRAIIYIPTINPMKEAAQYADDGWRNICCLWGLHNTDHTMTEQQLQLRDAILTTKRIPDDVDLLFINAAYETSININNEDYRTVIVHSSNPDVHTQVRGRLRHDIDTLYLHDSNHEHVSDYFPEEYLDKFLTTKETRAISEKMDLRNSNGQILKWPTIRDKLANDGYTIDYIKKGGIRGYVIHKRT